MGGLSGAYRWMFHEFLARLTEARIPVVIVETWRSIEAHNEDLKAGRSWSMMSKHTCTCLSGSTPMVEVPASKAMDVAPFLQYQLHGDDKLQWDANDPVWLEIGRIGRASGLKWGGDWGVKDMGHFEV